MAHIPVRQRRKARDEFAPFSKANATQISSIGPVQRARGAGCCSSINASFLSLFTRPRRQVSGGRHARDRQRALGKHPPLTLTANYKHRVSAVCFLISCQARSTSPPRFQEASRDERERQTRRVSFAPAGIPRLSLSSVRPISSSWLGISVETRDQEKN